MISISLATVIDMTEVHISSIGEKGVKKWLSFSFRPPMSTQRLEDKLNFTLQQQRRTKRFLATMDDCSVRSAKFRREKNSRQMKDVNRTAKKHLLKYGAFLFKIMKRVQSKPIKTFEDFFGDEFGEVVLNLDAQTRRFPWELAHDGEDFLFTKYFVGRTVTMQGERLSGYPPQNRKALVVGLDYADLQRSNQLETPESEALLVARRLKKMKYSPILLRGEQARKKNVLKILRQGVAIFHFSGHGNYLSNQPEGRKGRLVLHDGEITEQELRDCFDEAKGAPYLSFLNACDSAKEIYNSHLMDAFLDYGAENVIGTMWSVYDSPSKEMAVRFYDNIVRGNRFGEALLFSRDHFWGSRKTEETSTWPAFILYGSPGNSLPLGR